ncbi:MAG: site-specific integrase, partial [Planctomycetota bacterium]
MSTKRGNGDGSIYKRGDRYWISFYDENGERQTRSAKTTDRRLAERILREQTERVAKIRAGLIDPRAEQLVESGRRPIAELVEAFADKLNAEGRTPQYVVRTRREVAEFCESRGISSLGDITAEHATAYLESLRKAGQAARTRQCRITSVKGFTRWAWRGGLIAADPLAGVKRPNPETDRRHRRRMLLVEEWHRLDAATQAAPDFRGMSGGERALVYAVALQTGLRAGELATLTKSSLHLSSDRPFVVVEAGGTKNRRVARQFVRRELADQLAEHAARKAPGAKLFRFPDQSKLASILRDDLRLAREAWIAEAAHDAD